jgi:hypothetical protein
MAFTGFHPTPDPSDPPLDLDSGAAEAVLLVARLSAAIEAAGLIPTEVTVYDRVSNNTVVQLHELAATLLRLAGVALALTTGQIDRRSARELGAQGMARQGGHRTPEQMARSVGNIPHHDAARAMRQGRLIHETQTNDTAETTGTPPPVNPTTGEVVTPLEPWLAGVGRALTRGLSLDAADAIRRGLGVPTEGVPSDALKAAADQLCREASRMDPDRLFIRARRLRDELDVAGIGLREEERRQKRSLILVKQRDGMAKMTWVMDPETYATVGEAYDRVTSPKRGGPRTGDGSTGDHAARIESDPRSVEQIASDSFAQLLQNGVATDPSLVLGTGVPAVRILTTRPLTDNPARPGRSATSGTSSTSDIRSGSGDSVDSGGVTDAEMPISELDDGDIDEDHDSPEAPAHEHPCQDGRHHRHAHSATGSRVTPAGQRFGPGWIEGQDDPVSPETVARMVCTGSTSTIEFDNTGQPTDPTAEQRLYSRKQRRSLGARDGGCRWTNAAGIGTCDRPPSWTEAHHVEQWKRDGGRTTIENGILLCKHHHLMLHNDGWEIHREAANYWLIPPVAVDPQQTPRLMAARSPAFEQLQRVGASAESEQRNVNADPEPRPGPDREPGDGPDLNPPPQPPVPLSGTTSNGTTYLLVPRRSASEPSKPNEPTEH